MSRPVTIELTADRSGPTVRLTADVELRQTDFGIKPFSLMAGSLKVADVVTVSLSAAVSGT